MDGRTYFDLVFGIMLFIYGHAILSNVVRGMYDDGEVGALDWTLSAAMLIVGLGIIFATLVDLGILPQA